MGLTVGSGHGYSKLKVRANMANATRTNIKIGGLYDSAKADIGYTERDERPSNNSHKGQSQKPNEKGADRHSKSRQPAKAPKHQPAFSGANLLRATTWTAKMMTPTLAIVRKILEFVRP